MVQEGSQTGLLISFDGLDSSGKATQSRKLGERLRYNGWVVREFQTPDYSTGSGKELKLRLQNKIGDWAKTSWQEKMMLFANNRAEHKDEVITALQRGEIVIYDRYVPSSLAFIAVEALLPQEIELQRESIYRAVENKEYEEHGMPREGVSVVLDVRPEIAVSLLSSRKKKHQDNDEYTDQVDIQKRLYNEYDYMCNADPKRYMRIRCIEGTELLPIEAVEELVWEGLTHRFPFLREKR